MKRVHWAIEKNERKNEESKEANLSVRVLDVGNTLHQLLNLMELGTHSENDARKKKRRQ